MKNRFIAGLTLCAFMSLGFPAAALSAERAGEVESVNGKVLIQTESGWDTLGNSQLQEGALIRTAKGGEVLLKFPGDSRVRVSPSSQLKVVKIDEKGTSLLLERGRVLGKAEGSLNIETHRTSTNASEGEFVLETTPSGTELNVLAGNAKLSSDDEVTMPALEGLPEDIDSEALNALAGVSDVQQEGVIAAEDTEANGADDEEEDDDDNSAWAYGGVGVLVIAGVLFAMSGDGDDDEIVGTPSPNLP